MKKSSWKKKLLIALIIVVVLLLLVVGIGFAILHHYINKMNIVDDDLSSYEVLESIEPDDDLTSEPDSPPEEIDKIENVIQENVENNTIDPISDDEVYNVLLIGTDARDKSSRGRSDSMILLSINKKTKKVIMTSFLRDSYVYIPGRGNTRLNHAYAYGGAPLLLDTIKENFKIKIDKYVQVNFFSFIEAIDSVGGVEITVTDAEVTYVNSYLREINRLNGRPESEGQLSKGGTYNLSGNQALAYSRIRYIGTDFQRTERQRTVLEKLIQKMNGLSISELTDLLDVILPQITTNIQESEIISLIMNSKKYLSYTREQCRVPADNTWWNLTVRQMAVLGMDFDANIKYLRSHIYNQ